VFLQGRSSDASGTIDNQVPVSTEITPAGAGTALACRV
jgi:hypothetical protein